MAKHKFVIEIDAYFSDYCIKEWETKQINYYMRTRSKEDAKKIVEQNGFFKTIEKELEKNIEKLCLNSGIYFFDKKIK